MFAKLVIFSELSKFLSVKSRLSADLLSLFCRFGLSTYIFIIDRDEDGIEELESTNTQSSAIEYYDLQGRRLNSPKGLYIEKRADGTTRKVMPGRGNM